MHAGDFEASIASKLGYSDNQKNIVDKELRRILSSKYFLHAPMLSSFLEYVVRKTLSRNEEYIKAYTIATDALDRTSEFDPASDTIVRTTAGRVRKALDAYYDNQTEPPLVRISLPKGRYIPHFTLNEPGAPHDRPVRKRLSFAQSIFTAHRKAVIVCVFILVAISVGSIVAWTGTVTPAPDTVILDVHPTNYANQQSQSLARSIDISLSPSLARIGIANVIPSSIIRYKNDFGPPEDSSIIPFILKTSIIDSQHPRIVWKILDARSGYLLWAGIEKIEDHTQETIQNTVDRIAFHVLGLGGAIPLAIERYYGGLFSRATCITRAQIVEAVKNDILFPEMRECLSRIVNNSPSDASAWAVLSILYTIRSRFYLAGSYAERAALIAQAEQAAEKAAEIAPTAYLTKIALMRLALRQGRIEDFDRYQDELRKMFPGDIYLKIGIATRLARLGRGREAIEIFDEAENEFGISLKKWSPGVAVAYFSEGEFQKAHRWIQKTTSDLRFVLVLKTAIAGKLGMEDEASAFAERLLRSNPDIKETFYPWLGDLGWEYPLVREVADGLAKAGLVVDPYFVD